MKFRSLREMTGQDKGILAWDMEVMAANWAGLVGIPRNTSLGLISGPAPFYAEQIELEDIPAYIATRAAEVAEKQQGTGGPNGPAAFPGIWQIEEDDLYIFAPKGWQ